MTYSSTLTRKPQPISRLRLAARLPTGTRLNQRSVWLISILPDYSSKSIRVQLNPCRRTSHERIMGLGCACQKETATQNSRNSAGASDKAGPTLFRYRPKAQGRDRGTRLSVVRVYALAFPDNLHKPSFGTVEILGSEWFTLRTCKLKPTNDLERGPPGRAGRLAKCELFLTD